MKHNSIRRIGILLIVSLLFTLVAGTAALAATAKKVTKAPAKPSAAQITVATLNLANAAKGNNAYLLQQALKGGGNPNAKDAQYGRPAIVWVSYHNNLTGVKLLLTAKADVNALDKENSTALIRAAAKGYTEVVKTLLTAKPNLNVKDNAQKNALLYAVEGGYLDVFQAILAAKPDLTLADSKGVTPLMYACNKPTTPAYEEMVKELIAAGADVNAKDLNNTTALMIAAQNGRIDTVNALIAAKAELKEKDNKGHTAYEYAMLKLNNPLMKVLEKAGGK